MSKPLVLIYLLIGQILFYSCHIAHDREIICYDNLKKATDLAYKNPNDPAVLDSALVIVNRSMQCDSIKTAVVDLKIRLLITLSKFKEGSAFVDSLQSSDFIYPYKKKLNHDNFIALNYASKNDTISRDNTLRQMTSDLEKYINSSNLSSKEFQEAFTDLFTLKENLVDTTVINKEIDSLKIKYPDNAKFLDLFKH